ncbi:hypothetical protein ABZW18_31495 [Streptomyces sp. NPDC004647]|uniref:hypothetical protein n=1 Tax=Streptomyces sp. NPDC004647 TaxID=3154671 RepID=UPI0033BBC0B6
MTTIRRNWTKRVDAIRAAAKFCRAYDSSTGNMVPVDPARAFEAWQANGCATLSEDTPGERWRVRVHSNRRYVLTATDPEQDRQEREETATAAPIAVAAPVTSAAPTRSRAEEAALNKAGEYIKDAPGIGAHTAAAATTVLAQKVRAGELGRDRLTAALPGITAAVTAKAVADMRAQGLTHEQIRMRLERKKAEAEHAGDTGRAMVADAMIAAHAGIVADEEQAHPAQAPAQRDRGSMAQLPAPERHAAHRLAAEERPALRMPEERRRQLCRQSEERYRPVAVYVYLSPITGGAALRWLDAEERDCANLWDPVPLEGRHAHAMRDEVLNEAGAVLAKRGFNYARGAYWEPYARRGTVNAVRPEAARVAIVPTRAYLDYQARRFGPLPQLPQVPGVRFKTTQRGQWWATLADGPTFLLTWSPMLDGDRWHVWGGAQHSELIRSTRFMDKALFVLRHPAHARP